MAEGPGDARVAPPEGPRWFDRLIRPGLPQADSPFRLTPMAGRRRLSEARRVQILDAAAQVIGRRGMCETRIADIASVAGTSSALVLYYFGSKDRLLAEALTYADEQFYDETVEGLSEVGSARERLVRLIDLSCPYEREGDR